MKHIHRGYVMNYSWTFRIDEVKINAQADIEGWHLYANINESKLLERSTYKHTFGDVQATVA